MEIGGCAAGAAAGGEHAICGLAADPGADVATDSVSAAATRSAVLVQGHCIGEGEEREEDCQKGNFEVHCEI